MSAIAIKFLLEKEIKKVNKMIDQKISEGRPYKKEARLHKRLVGKLGDLQKKHTKASWAFLLL